MAYGEELHRTLVQLLIDTNNRELAAAILDGDVQLLKDDQGYAIGMNVDVPTAAYDLVSNNPTLKQTLVRVAKTVAIGQFFHTAEPEVRLRVKLIQPEEGWVNIARDMIVNYKGDNQAHVSAKMFLRERREMLTYNEANYASQSEIRIAQEFEERGVLFFPLAMGIRADTGELYRDHREADFVVCVDGVWGILECSFHPNRYEKDAERTRGGRNREFSACSTIPPSAVTTSHRVLSTNSWPS